MTHTDSVPANDVSGASVPAPPPQDTAVQATAPPPPLAPSTVVAGRGLAGALRY